MTEPTGSVSRTTLSTLIVLMFLIRIANGHSGSASLLEMMEGEGHLRAILTATNDDLASVLARDDRDAMVFPDYFEERIELLQGLVRDRVNVIADGVQLEVTVGSAQLAIHPPTQIETAMILVAPWNAKQRPRQITIECRLFPRDVISQTHVIARTFSSPPEEATLTATNPTFDWTLPDEPSRGVRRRDLDGSKLDPASIAPVIPNRIGTSTYPTDGSPLQALGQTTRPADHEEELRLARDRDFLLSQPLTLALLILVIVGFIALWGSHRS